MGTGGGGFPSRLVRRTLRGEYRRRQTSYSCATSPAESRAAAQKVDAVQGERAQCEPGAAHAGEEAVKIPIDPPRRKRQRLRKPPARAHPASPAPEYGRKDERAAQPSQHAERCPQRDPGRPACGASAEFSAVQGIARSTTSVFTTPQNWSRLRCLTWSPLSSQTCCRPGETQPSSRSSMQGRAGASSNPPCRERRPCEWRAAVQNPQCGVPVW